MKTEITTVKSKKNGNEYLCLKIEITDNYSKLVFLSDAEVALVKAAYNI